MTLGTENHVSEWIIMMTMTMIITIVVIIVRITLEYITEILGQPRSACLPSCCRHRACR